MIPLRYLIPITFLCSGLAFAGESVLVKCGKEWINIHKNNKDLIGVYVQQYPDSVPDQRDYEGTHPVMIIYVFKDGITHTVTYSPTGQTEDGIWGKIGKDHWVYKVMSKNLNLEKECAYWYGRK